MIRDCDKDGCLVVFILLLIFFSVNMLHYKQSSKADNQEQSQNMEETMHGIEITQVGDGKYIATFTIGTLSSGVCDSKFDAGLELVENVREVLNALTCAVAKMEDGN